MVAARALASKANGIAAAPRLAIAARPQQQQQAPAALEVVAADGPRGMKLKSRKVRRAGPAGRRCRLTLVLGWLCPVRRRAAAAALVLTPPRSPLRALPSPRPSATR